MANLILVLGDQLTHSISSINQCTKETDLVLMCEVIEEATYVRHHKKKIAFIFSAMRHFANELVNQGFKVHYTKLDDTHNSGSFRGEIQRALGLYNFDKIIVTHPGEYRVLNELQSWSKLFAIKVVILPDNRFLASQKMFEDWAQGQRQLRMEYFYREMRKRYSILMENDKPVGGEWNYDNSNRKPLKTSKNIPGTYRVEPDQITFEVLEMVSTRFSEHFGQLESLDYAVNREQALAALNLFIEERLPLFGDYQDAMLEENEWLYHSHLSLYLNCGLLLPIECVQLAEKAYYSGKAPLNAVEGFIRQIIGWREFIRGIYWLKMPEYSQSNFLNAKRNLPAFYWTAQTKMNCLRQCVINTQRNAYAHHIQRLMVLGNFALLAGINPIEVNQWFLVVYADAYEWVELPNVTGMILFADGGYLASKPYAASGSYINKMSNYCKNCEYQVKEKTGPNACPFNYLYWNFLASNRDKLIKNPRLSIAYRNYDQMDEEKKQRIAEDSQIFLNQIA